jgi:RNA polymerase sigma-70 factor (ECF subfamily)
MSNILTGPIAARADEDAEFVAATQKGDLDAFESLVQKHQKRMFNIALRVLGSADDASEVVQDAFVAAYRNLRSFKGEAKFSTWLTAIVINHAKNRLKKIRSRERHEAYSLDEPLRTQDGEILTDPPSAGPTVLERLEKRDVQKSVLDCIHALEPGFREVLVLRDMQEFSYEEIGNMLRMREGTVKSRLFRAREAVKECLKKILGDIL